MRNIQWLNASKFAYEYALYAYTDSIKIYRSDLARQADFPKWNIYFRQNISYIIEQWKSYISHEQWIVNRGYRMFHRQEQWYVKRAEGTHTGAMNDAEMSVLTLAPRQLRFFHNDVHFKRSSRNELCLECWVITKTCVVVFSVVVDGWVSLSLNASQHNNNAISEHYLLLKYEQRFATTLLQKKKIK